MLFRSNFTASRRRDRLTGVSYPPGKGAATAITVVLGIVAWLAFALFLHGWLIGVRPFG